MATVHLARTLRTDAETAWRRLAALDRVHELVSFLEDATVEGDRRVCRIRPGGPLEGALSEIILAVEPALRRIAYRIVDSPFGFEEHAASMQIVQGPGGVRFVWTTDLKPDALAEAMASTFEAEADHIAAALSR